MQEINHIRYWNELEQIEISVLLCILNLIKQEYPVDMN